MLGIPSAEIAIDWTQVVFNMLTLKGIYGREMYETWYQMTVMLQSGLDIAPVITHRFSYDEFEPAFAAAASGDAGKVVLDWRSVMTAGSPDRRAGRAAGGAARAGPVQGRARDRDPAGRTWSGRRSRRRAEPVRQQLPRAWPSHPEIVAAAHEALDRWGFGMASVRFICGTQAVHKRAGGAVCASSSAREDTILYCSCFDANGGLFETLLGPEDAVISDELNHASIIDGIRLCKAQRLRYANRDMAELEARLHEASGARHRLIATDGVFSMDGYVAGLAGICDLAERYDALVMVDDSHAVGFVGEHGRGTPELHGVIGRVDIITGTLGKAMGGASGGYIGGAPRDRRAAAAAVAALPVLEQHRAAGGGRHADGARSDRALGRCCATRCAANTRTSAAG